MRSAARRRNATRALLPTLVALALCPMTATCGTFIFAPELNAVASMRNGEGHGAAGAQRSSAGFEAFGTVSGRRGDLFTWNLQARLSHDSRLPDERWGIEVHNAWVEHRLGLGRKLRLGHFSPAFGLEPSLDTHGTLLQTLAGRSIGFKKDWGIGYEGLLGPLDGAVALQLGSGAPIDRRDGSYLATIRVSSPPGRAVRIGASALLGRPLDTGGARLLPAPEAPVASQVTRIGIDTTVATGAAEVRCELIAGRDGGVEVAGGLVGVDLALPGLQRLTLESQATAWSGDLSADGEVRSDVALGASYRATPHWTLRVLAEREIEAPGWEEATIIALQLYYYGG